MSPFPENAVWIDPPVIDAGSAGVGYIFHVTVWANLSVPSFVWQVRVSFNPTHLRATQANYTGQDKSRFFTGHNTIPVNPVIRNTRGEILYGEALVGSDIRLAGNDSLCTIEFEVTSQTTQTKLDIESKDTFILDGDLNIIPCVKYSATVSQTSGSGVYITCVEPSQAYPGTSVHAYGGGATPEGLVALLVHGPINQAEFINNNSTPLIAADQDNMTLGTTYATESGTWDTNFTTPNLYPGDYNVYVLDNETLNSDATLLRIEISDTAIPPNSPIIIYPNGTDANATVILPGSPIIYSPDPIAGTLSLDHIWTANATQQNASLSTTTTTMIEFSSSPLMLALTAGVLVMGSATLVFLVSVAARKNNLKRKHWP